MKWDTFQKRIQDGSTSEGLHEIKNAFDLMESTHDGERRDDNRPYRLHPIEATIGAHDLGERDPEVLAAILGHDTLESAKKLGKPVTTQVLEQKLGTATACRVSWMTKEGHTDEARAKHWQHFRACKDHKAYKAKSFERLDNVKSFSSMKGKPGETKRERIRRKVKETVREFAPIIAWLEADVEIRSFGTEEARNAERMLIRNLREAFRHELGKYGAKFP